MSFLKHRKDPERNNQPVIEPGNTHVPEPVDMCKLYQISAEHRQKRLEETPRLEEFENIVKQYVNDFIVFQTNAFEAQGKTWNPTIDSVYFCYTRIKKELMLNDDKEFRDWYVKTDIADIRQIISREICAYIQRKKLHNPR